MKMRPARKVNNAVNNKDSKVNNDSKANRDNRVSKVNRDNRVSKANKDNSRDRSAANKGSREVRRMDRTRALVARAARMVVVPGTIVNSILNCANA